VVQRTGWGKSAVYFISTNILRENGFGPTILISPLLALMRNQIGMSARLGIQAATINSSNTDDWPRITTEFAEDAIDLLLVSPERFANAQFRQEVLVADFACDLAEALDLPLHAVVSKVATNQPQKEMQNSAQQYFNVAHVFRVSGQVSSGPVLLIDDLFDSRWTLTLVGVALREAGSGPTFPFVLAAAVNS
jgi:hypothetical protein